MPLETDIVERLRADFGRVDSDTAIRLLTEARQAGRVARCIVVASRGSLPLLRANVELARSDYRDAIMAGEYERGEHLRDLSASFLIDTPEKFWIGQVALVMAPRGYALTSSRPVPRPSARSNTLWTGTKGRRRSPGRWATSGSKRPPGNGGHSLTTPACSDAASIIRSGTNAPFGMRYPSICSLTADRLRAGKQLLCMFPILLSSYQDHCLPSRDKRLGHPRQVMASVKAAPAAAPRVRPGLRRARIAAAGATDGPCAGSPARAGTVVSSASEGSRGTGRQGRARRVPGRRWRHSTVPPG